MIEAPSGLAGLAERLREAGAARRQLCLVGGGTKAFYGEPAQGEPLDLAGLLDGPALHEPTELVVTAPGGMTVAALEARLAEAGQCLAFEPPRFGPGGTVGGMVAAGLSGPARARVGSLRDHLLGVSLLDGRGELLQFGGKVIKNVAGYDVSRAVAGSMGILGVVVQASLKVLPRADAETTLRFDLKPAEALSALHGWGAQPLPLDASAWWNGNLIVRLRGAAAAVDAAARELGGEPIPEAAAKPFWDELRDQRDPFFAAAAEAIEHQDAALWRLSVPQTAPLLALAGDELIEWHGAQRWLVTSLSASLVREAAARVGGHATLFRGKDKSAGAFAPLAAPLQAIHERLKRAFDPHGILNPGRLYPGL